jgi:hypothetical protein
MRILDTSHSTTKSYATFASATKAIEKLEVKCGEDFTVIMSARPDGRIAPIIKLSPDQMYRAGALAHNGFYVTN